MSEFFDMYWNSHLQVSNLEVAGFSRNEIINTDNSQLFQNCLYLGHCLGMSACTAPWTLSEKTGMVNSQSAQAGLQYYRVFGEMIDLAMKPHNSLGPGGLKALFPLVEIVKEIRGTSYDLSLEAVMLYLESNKMDLTFLDKHAFEKGLITNLSELDVARERIDRFKLNIGR
jgi:hypothetical protein